jgi:hypothetical protein
VQRRLQLPRAVAATMSAVRPVYPTKLPTSLHACLPGSSEVTGAVLFLFVGLGHVVMGTQIVPERKVAHDLG